MSGRLWRLRKKGFVIGAAILLFWTLCAVLGPAIAPYSAVKVDLDSELLYPSLTHPFGTDDLGRDVLSRVIVGARDIVTYSLCAAAFATFLGLCLGLLAGYFGRVIDGVLSRIGETIMSIPGLIFALLVVTALGHSFFAIVFAIGFGDAWAVARTIKSVVITLRYQDYVSMAQLRGESSLYIMFRELLPNALGVVLVEFTTRIGLSAFALASLAFLGLGVQPPEPAWGLQISAQYTQLMTGIWWPVLFPALAIASFVIAIYLMVDALQDRGVGA
ncbi:MAG TPA: ABC transporter permease [Bauldia sp.]|nr:ABC transporter permease [Bauldia sp.]